MTPVREFLYLLIIIVIFGLLLYLREEDPQKTEPVPAGHEDPDTPVTVYQPGDNYKQPSLEKEETDEDEQKIVLFNTTPLVFAVDDTSRFQYLFDKLQHIDREKLPVRIVYFGDSQIENDQITSALREEFQKRYGGKGPGFVPLDSYYNVKHQLMAEISNNWEIKTFTDKEFVNQSLLFKNTMLTKRDKQAWFRIRRIKNLNPTPDYQLIKLYYRTKDSCQVTVKKGRQTIYSGYLLPKDEVSALDFQFNRTPDDVRFDLMPHDTLNISGLSLESGSGVLVDNIALRGLSYPTFGSSDQENIKQMLDKVNVGMFILHFGVNLVPYLSANYQHFKNNFQKQLDFLKESKPGVPILIIGVSDMSEKQGTQFVSYPNILAVKAIQRKIAMENHAAFWDLQQFMGGEGGMVNWVGAKPALARKDYTHFSKQGATTVGREIAGMIFNELNANSTFAQ